MKVAVIGYGGRGQKYAGAFKRRGIDICAVCDIRKDKLDLAQKELGLTDDCLFDNEKDFFAKGKIADIAIISTLDDLHKEHAIKALNVGYDLILEKPIATTIEDCIAVADCAKKLGRKVFVCHVLRYAPFFNWIKEELSQGKLGKIVTMEVTENVGYWHQAHSFVRGNWASAKKSTPMIIAKCCHDLDIISWLMNKKCAAVSSFGGLSLFKKENAPDGCAEYCLDCKYNGQCEYSAETYYIKNQLEKGNVWWPCNIVVIEPTVEKMYKALKEGPYGKCVFKCDNDVVDHQVVNMAFEGGSTASLTMTAFSEKSYRRIHVHCEHGEIYGTTEDNVLHIRLFGQEEKIVDAKLECDSYGHGGGDEKMIDDMVNFLRGKSYKALTSIDTSLQSHVIGFNAEKSRLHNGEVVKL